MKRLVRSLVSGRKAQFELVNEPAQRRLVLLSIFGVVAVAMYWLHLLGDYEFAGHADKSFYFLTAKRMIQGQGLEIPYVWHFLGQYDKIDHYAFDYWLPGASLAFALSMSVIGATVQAAALVSTLATLLLCIITFVAARLLTDSRWIAPIAALLVCLIPPISEAAVDTETVALYAALAGGSLVLMLGAGTSLTQWFFVGATAGLAHLTRNDGVLLLIVAAVTLFLRRKRISTPGRLGAALICGYLVVLAPLIYQNYSYLGRPLPAAITVMPFITSFEDVYSTYPPSIPSFEKMVKVRLDAVRRNIGDIFRATSLETASGLLCSILLIQMAVLSVANLLSAKWEMWRNGHLAATPWLPPMLFATLLFALHSFITPAVSSAGAWSKSAVAILPFLVIAALNGANNLGRFLASKEAVLFLCGSLFIPAVIGLTYFADKVVIENNEAGRRELLLKPLLDAETRCQGKEVVVMTRKPWQLTEVTGYRSVMIPNDNLDRILEIGRKLGVTHLLLPAPRKALQDTSTLIGDQGPFSVVGRVDSRMLLRVRESTVAVQRHPGC